MTLRKTPLHDAHIKLGAKMGEFAGYDMPLYYKDGVMKEHEWVRAECGLFDVSHMGQAMIKGPEGSKAALAFVQKLTPSSFEKLATGKTKYTVLTNEKGGIIDDLMIAKSSDDEFHLVLNAGCKDKDLAWLRKNLTQGLELTYFEDWALLALQGQKSESVVREVLGIDLSGLGYMEVWYAPDYTMFISRLGYTGEDGFEISVKNEDALNLWNKLLKHDAVKPIGLAARDSLRLEMGYCLYGHDIDDTTSPVEANLNWIMGKGENATFIGAERILKEKEGGPSRLRVGVKLTQAGIAREGAEIRNEKDQKIGTLTSGGFSPSLKQSIGQGYIDPAYATLGTKIFVNVRGKNIAAEVSAMPFLPARTKSIKKEAA